MDGIITEAERQPNHRPHEDRAWRRSALASVHVGASARKRDASFVVGESGQSGAIRSSAALSGPYHPFILLHRARYLKYWIVREAVSEGVLP